MKPLLGIIPKCCSYVLFNYEVEGNVVKATCPDCGPVEFGPLEVKA